MRNLALPAVMLLAFAGAAHAQSGIQPSGPNGMLQDKDATDRQAAKEYIERKQNDAKYQDAIRNQASAPTSNDPWGSVRSTPAPAVKSAAKPAGTKSAGGTAKLATTPKSQ